MDPDSGSKNANIINFFPDGIDLERVSFNETNGEKLFALAHFNDSSHSLVTCTAKFSGDYDLLSCHIVVTDLNKQYGNISSHDADLSLTELFEISDRCAGSERLVLSFDGEHVSSYICSDDHIAEYPISWILDLAIKDDDPKYMDNNDKMLDYLCTKFINNRLYKSLSPFKKVEGLNKARIMKANLRKKAV